ncbi:MAG: hypothetical protein Rubg2KO_24800 [Rubricoccaceae bacterium]
MTKSDWASLGFYAFLFGFAFISFASQDMDTMIVLAILTMTVAAVHGTRVVLRSRQRDDEWDESWDAAHQLNAKEEMDIHRVLDLDQRLEALERAETRRLHELANEGVTSVPEAALESEATTRPTRQRV